MPANLQYYITFDSPMPARQWSDPNSKCKFGFNGKEKDNEINVNGGDYDFGARIYDIRLGRWLACDPLAKKYPKLSPFNFVSNNPLIFVDIVGKDWILYCGTQVSIYSGKAGNVSKPPLKVCRGTSDACGFQNANNQNNPDQGPCVEGKYTINLTGPPKYNISNGANGVTTMWGEDTKTNSPILAPEWGQWRTRLNPDAATAKAISNNGRTGGFYFHDSYKGETHGCIEVESALYTDLENYRLAGNLNIEVLVKYEDPYYSTNGNTGSYSGTTYNPAIPGSGPSNLPPWAIIQATSTTGAAANAITVSFLVDFCDGTLKNVVNWCAIPTSYSYSSGKPFSPVILVTNMGAAIPCPTTPPSTPTPSPAVSPAP